jgi:hypothetical protein
MEHFMAIVKVGSTNPDLSFVLAKNPNTIIDSKKPYTKELRKGCVYGWYTNETATEFKMWFRDSDLASSFVDGERGEFEYLDTSRYSSGLAPISMITQCLATALKKPDEKDTEGFEAYCTFPLKISNRRYNEMLAKSYQGIASIDATPIYGDHYEITIRAPRVYTVLNIAMLVCLMQCLNDDDTYVRLDKSGVEKYITCLNAANAPYFVRYLFAMRAIQNRAVFEQMKPKLQGPGMELQFGNTRQQRFDAISGVLTGGETLIDIGCGEMFYALRFCSKYETVFAVDGDPEIQEINRGKVAKRQIDNITPLEVMATPEWVKENESLFDGADVLLTEVVEHMPQADATALIEAIMKTNYRKLVITTPNKDFNRFYGFAEDDTRHPDHHFELPYTKFVHWMDELWESKTSSATVWGIGDRVEGTSVTSAAVFERHVAIPQKTVTLEIADPEPDTSPSSTESVQPTVPARQLEGA